MKITTFLGQDFSILALVRKVCHGVMKIYNSECVIEVSKKTDSSPLTQADLYSHRVLKTELEDITPGVPVVSEEDPASFVYRQSYGAFWLIDPLDGTKEFISRNGEFTVNVALIEDGQAVFGVVGAPALDLLYWGGLGLGAFREVEGVIEAIQVSASHVLPHRLVASRSHMNEETETFIEKLRPYELVQAGSSLKFCRVAEGSADCYPRMGLTCEWDTAAAQAIVEAAGGFVCSLDGKPLCYGKPDILNPNFIVGSAIFYHQMKLMGYCT